MTRIREEEVKVDLVSLVQLYGSGELPGELSRGGDVFSERYAECSATEITFLSVCLSVCSAREL